MKLITRRGNRPAKLAGALVAAALVVAACGGDDGDGDGDDSTGGGASGSLTMGTGSTGGTYFPLGGVIAQTWSENLDDTTVSVQASGASVANLQLLTNGEIDIAMAINGTASDALAGEVDLGGADADITYLGAVYKEVNQIIARSDAGIETVEDLDGKTVAIGPPGSGTELFARAIFDIAGISVDERQESFGDAADLLRDGTIDASFAVLALPAGSLEEVSTAVDLNLVSLEGDLLQQVLDGDPTLTEVPYSGEYSNIEQDATLVTNWASMYVRSDLDEDLAYDLARVMYEQTEAISVGHAVGAEVQLETALDGVADVPIHPGAERFYEEQGAL